MNQCLPQSDFKWLTQNEINSIDWSKTKEEDDIGYILEVDLKYPPGIHDFHIDYPLAPEKSKILNNELSKYQTNTLKIMEKFNYKRIPTEKLMLTLRDKTKYIVHFRNLKLYIRLGLEILKIHRVLSFKQSAWLRPYIEYNTELRKNAKSDFEKDLIKLLNNAVFGKSIENKRKHANIKLALNESQAKRYLRKPLFEEFHILNSTKALIKMKKSFVILDKPIYIGFTVLELSKMHMYRLHYDCFKKYYKDDLTLAYTDTDSLIYEIKTNDFYRDLEIKFKEIMDFSDYPDEHYLKNDENKKQLGYLKDEMNSKIINEFIGLKAKLYSIKYGDKSEYKSKAKGLQKSVLNKYITHEHYKNVLLNNNIYSTKMHRIQSKFHKIETIELNKLIFTPIDDKRYILDNGIKTLPYGYKSLKS